MWKSWNMWSPSSPSTWCFNQSRDSSHWSTYRSTNSAHVWVKNIHTQFSCFLLVYSPPPIICYTYMHIIQCFILIVCFALLMFPVIPLLLIFCQCGRFEEFSELPFDTKEYLIAYHTESKGEDKVNYNYYYFTYFHGPLFWYYFYKLAQVSKLSQSVLVIAPR